MKIETKIQIDALKQLENDKNKKPCYAEGTNGLIYFCPEGVWAMKIYDSDFWIDKSKLKTMESLPNNFNACNLSNTSKLEVTNNLIRLEKGTVTILRGDKFQTHINDKYLKLLYRNCCEIYAKNEKSIIYFVLDDEIYACVMPVNMEKSA